jgi:tRNA threonylcarbamoyladenosine biosynthesis protein TsaE
MTGSVAGAKQEARFAIPEEHDTRAFAARLASRLRPSDLLILTGDLGAGKTFFTGALLHRLGLPEEEPVTSPTFALACEYPTEPRSLHADLYRLSSDDDVFELGLEERRALGSLLVVEWGLPFLSVLGGDGLELVFELEPRVVELRSHGPRGDELLEDLLRA